MTGVALLDALNQRGNHLPVIVMSGYSETPLVVEAMRIGAVDFRDRPLEPAVVLAKVWAVIQGAEMSAVPRSEATRAMRLVRALTRRERDVLAGLDRGLSTKQMADDLGVSPKTVESHRIHLQDKLGITNAQGLIRLSIPIALLGMQV